jgi:DNA-binding phage protein
MSWVVLLIDKDCTPYVAKAPEQFRHNERYHCHLVVLVVEIKAPKIKTFLEHSNTGRIFKRDAMTTHRSYKFYLIESLKDPAEAAAYLDAVLDDGNLEHIVLALKNVAESRRSRVDNFNEPDPVWENCYRLLDQGKTPELPAILALLNELGLKLSVTAKEELPV